MPHWIFQKVLMRNKFLIWNGLKDRFLNKNNNSAFIPAPHLRYLQLLYEQDEQQTKEQTENSSCPTSEWSRL